MFKTLFRFINAHKIIVSIILAIAIAATFFFASGEEKNTLELITIKRQDIKQEVSVTGRVTPARDVDLAFERSGRVANVYVDIGDQVIAGQKLIRLNNEELIAQFNEAKAGVKAQQARLDELKSGAQSEDIEVKEAELQKYRKDLLTELNDAYTKADDAVNTKTALVFSGSPSGFYQLTFTACNSQAEGDATNLRSASDEELSAWRNESSKYESAGKSELTSLVNNAKNHLAVIKNFLQQTNIVLTTSCARNNTALDTYRSSVSAARASIDSALGNIISLEQIIDKAEKELALKLSGTRSEQVIAQEAQVEQAQARLQNIQAQINKTVLYAPISGTITKQDAMVGEIISPNAPLVSIISNGNFEIEADVPEADIAKINVGNSANLTLDAYGNEAIFPTKVSAINPAENIIDGVATYKVTLQFLQKDNRVRSGMTANIDILAAEKKDVIVIPQRAVTTADNGDKIVKISNEKDEIQEITVTTGLRGSDGNIEITNGVKEGDKIVVFEKQQ